MAINVSNARQIYLENLFNSSNQFMEKGKYHHTFEIGKIGKELFYKTNHSHLLLKFLNGQESIYFTKEKLVENESNRVNRLVFFDRLIMPEKRADVKFMSCECNLKLENLSKTNNLSSEIVTDFGRMNEVERKITTKFLLSDYWITLNELDSAKYYLEKGLNESRAAKLPSAVARSYFGYSKFFSAQKDWQGALDQTALGIKIFESLRFWPCVIMGYNEMAKLYLKIKKFHSAAQASINVLEIINKVNMPTEHCQALVEMCHSYNSLNLVDQAKYWLDSAEKLLPTIPSEEFYLYARYYEVKKDVELRKGNLANSKLAEDKYLEIQEKIKKLGMDYSVINTRFNYQLEVLRKNNEILQNKYRYYYFLLPIVSILCLIFIILSIQQVNTVKSLKKKNGFLVSELEEIRKEQLLDLSADSKSLFDKIKFNQLNSILKYQLNDTDFKLLEIIYTNPYSTNKNMSILVNISYEGVRSSLKKMYKIFGVAESVGNKKLSLLTNVLRASSEITAKLKLKENKQ